MKAKYSLEIVFDCIDKFLNEGEETVWFSAKSRSIDQVIKIFTNMLVSDAQHFILNGIKRLSEKDFVNSTYQWESVMDVYALAYEGHDWYIKFCVEDGSLEEVSFHPLQKPIKTALGAVLGENNYEE